ncbi:MAG: DNA-binding protein [Candidatus Zixiibacteriota bacterium]|nr:MAG: DNA-binding protein [candidate division Zixibacteria bacterium]
MIDQSLLTVDQIAAYLQVQPSTIYQWTHEGYIPHVKLGNLVRFRVSQVDRWLEKREVAGKTKRRMPVSFERVEHTPSKVA